MDWMDGLSQLGRCAMFPRCNHPKVDGYNLGALPVLIVHSIVVVVGARVEFKMMNNALQQCTDARKHGDTFVCREFMCSNSSSLTHSTLFPLSGSICHLFVIISPRFHCHWTTIILFLLHKSWPRFVLDLPAAATCPTDRPLMVYLCVPSTAVQPGP